MDRYTIALNKNPKYKILKKKKSEDDLIKAECNEPRPKPGEHEPKSKWDILGNLENALNSNNESYKAYNPFSDDDIKNEQVNPNRTFVMQWPMGHRTLIPFNRLNISVETEGQIIINVTPAEASRISSDLENAVRINDERRMNSLSDGTAGISTPVIRTRL